MQLPSEIIQNVPTDSAEEAFFLWNPCWADLVMVAYALAANLPCILAQRYNRSRFQRLL